MVIIAIIRRNVNIYFYIYTIFVSFLHLSHNKPHTKAVRNTLLAFTFLHLTNLTFYIKVESNTDT